MKRVFVLTLILVFLLSGCDAILPPVPTLAPTIAVTEVVPTRTPVILPTPTEFGTPALDQLPQVIMHDCPFETSTVKIECGSLFVEETRDDPNSNVIEVAFVRYRSQLQVPAADPVIYLGSAIGYTGIHNVEETWADFPLLYNRDLILIDHRGSGASLPSIDCPEVKEEWGMKDVEGISNCYARLLGEGIDLDAYNSAEIVHDVVDLMTKLGYGRANLIGADYGSRIALTMLRDYPERVRSLTLDSPIPINVNYYNERPLYFYDIFNNFITDFLEEEENYEVYGEIESVFYDLVRTLEFEPISFFYNHPDGAEEEIFYGAGDIVLKFQDMLSETSLIPAIPAFVSLMYAGEYEAAHQIYLNQEEKIEKAPFIEAGDFSEGLALSTLCREEVGFNDLDTAWEMIETYQKEVSDYLISEFDQIVTLCEIWQLEEAQAEENMAFTSTVPILILTGEYDTRSPATWATRLVIDFPNTFIYEFPQMGHYSLSNSNCAIPLVEEFINFPNSLPSNTCIDRLDIEPFIEP